MRSADHTGTTAALFNQTGIYFVILDLQKVMRELDDADGNAVLAARRYAEAQEIASTIHQLLPRLKPKPTEATELRRLLAELDARIAARRQADALADERPGAAR